MEKAVLLRNLEEVKKLADHAYGLIEAQSRIVASLTAAGVDATEAETTLDTYKKVQGRLLDEVQQILDALDNKEA